MEHERWRRAAASQNEGNCVELGSHGAVRDSKNPDGPTLAIDIAEFVSAVKAARIGR